MADLGLPDLLTRVQTIGIIAALLLTVYFSRRQIRALATDLEMRVLNDIDEKFHRIGEIFLERPEFVRTIYQTPTTPEVDVPFAYYLPFFCADVFYLRERKILGDNERAGWESWMRNAFRYGTLAKFWHESQMETWIDRAFREFVPRELVPLAPRAATAGS